VDTLHVSPQSYGRPKACKKKKPTSYQLGPTTFIWSSVLTMRRLKVPMIPIFMMMAYPLASEVVNIL